MPPAKIQNLAFLTPETELSAGSGSADLRVSLEDGKRSSFVVATPDQPARWMAETKSSFSLSTPVVYVRTLDRETVAQAAAAMASEMGGYWLRYFNSESDRSAVAHTLGAARQAKAPVKHRKSSASAGLKVVSTVITESYPPRSPEHGCAVIQAGLSDGREFSVLTATPSWFEKAFGELALPFYFGPSILFVKKLDVKIVRDAVKAMAADGDRWLTRYDTPRRTLPEVLSQFKDRHFPPQS